MKNRLRILQFEEDRGDAELIRLTLESEGIACDLLRVESRSAFLASLGKGGFDLILSDYSVEQFDGLYALAAARESFPDLPFIFVSAALRDQTAVELLKNGASDYVPKSSLSRLAPVVLRALREAEIRRRHRRAVEEIKAFHDINLAVTSALDLGMILQIALSKTDIFFPGGAAHVAEIDGAAIRLIAYRNLNEARWQAEPEPLWHSIVGSVVRSGRPVVRTSLEDEPAPSATFYRREGLVSYLGAPVILGGERIGVLSWFTGQEHEFTGEEIEFAQRLAEQAGIAIHISRLRESRRASRDLQDAERRIQNLSQTWMRAYDEEAKRIGRLLHDESGPSLASARIALAKLSNRLPASINERIEEVKSRLSGVQQRLRSLAHDLHPTILDDLGLVPSLEFLGERISRRAGLNIVIEDRLEARLAPSLEVTLYRIVREALDCLARSAHMTNVRVRLWLDHQSVWCSIEDDGNVFDFKNLSMPARERIRAVNGSLQTPSDPASDTKLVLIVPLEKIPE
jgi:signal transduction histidine kinase